MKPSNTPITLPDGQGMHFLNLGVLGLVLQSTSNTERLYFGTLSKELYSLPTSALDNSANEPLLNLTKVLGHGQRLGLCDAMTADNQQNIYMGLVDKTQVVRWNTSEFSDLNKQEIILDDPVLRWINSLWISDGYLWITHNK